MIADLKLNKHSSKPAYGFTLSEVLITLAIIGVVAALTVPVLVQNINNSQIAAAKKALAVANQAYGYAAADNGSGFGPVNTNANDNSYIKFNALKSKLNIIRECPYSSSNFGVCWSASGVGQSDTNIAGCGGFTNRPITLNQGGETSFVTSDGMYWMLYSYSDTSARDQIAIDVNGAKGPNDWGKDVFIFVLDDRTISPQNFSVYGACANLVHNDGTPLGQKEMLTPFVN